MMHNSPEVNEMSSLKLMTIDQKKKTNEKVHYYYSVNMLYNDKDLSGVVSMNLGLFDQLPAQIKDYTLKAMELFTKKEITIVRPSQEPMELPDCSDLYGVIAAGRVIKHYKELNEIPMLTGILTKDVIDTLLQYDEFSQFFIDHSIMSKEDIDKYRKENCIEIKEISKE